MIVRLRLPGITKNLTIFLRTKDDDERPTAKWEHIFDISAISYVLDIVAVGPCVGDLPELPPKPQPSCNIA